MAKAEWGTKRICHNCGARFYDLHRDPIVCPKCTTPYDPEQLLKSRRSRSVQIADLAAAKTARTRAAPTEVEDETAVADADAVEDVADEEEVETADPDLEDVESKDDEFDDEDADDSVLLEDASELGDDDVAIDVDGEEDDAR